jgi:hypothetical protein
MKKAKPFYFFCLISSFLTFQFGCGNDSRKLEFPQNREININESFNDSAIFILIDVLKDSLNSCDTTMVPFFLEDRLLDKKHPVKTDHGTFSCREIIISSVKRKDILYKIMSDEKYNNALSVDEIKTNQLEDIPDIKLSTSELAKKRLIKIQ